MKTERRKTIWFHALFFLVLAGALGLLIPSNSVGEARQGKPGNEPQSASKSEETKPSKKNLSNGIELRRGETLLSVVALRDDVVRVRLAINGVLPEDASWAVPHDIRSSKWDWVPKTPSNADGFHTKALRVRIDRATLRLTVSDLEGNV